MRVVEQAGELVARVLGAILDDLGVRHLPETEAVVRRHLLAVESGPLTAGNGALGALTEGGASGAHVAGGAARIVARWSWR